MTTHAERVKLTAERFAALKRELHAAGTDRTDAIREALAAGMTHREVAKHTGLSRQRVTQLGEPVRPPTDVCLHCHRAIIYTEADGWVDPNATGDDRTWRETCDSHDTLEANHEPEAHVTRGSHLRAT